MGKKKQSTNLGKAIIRDRFGKKERTVGGGDNFLHTADLQDGYDWGRLNLQSVTEQNNLDDFLTTAEMAGTEFTAEKLNVKFVSQDTGSLPKADEIKTIKGLHRQHEKLLRIPRRPPWHTEMAASELDQNEKTAFLEWRRTLASVQEDERIVMTPYEKNLDFWRQLWRVIERSDIVVQIVDARNPLLFYCADLESYVQEVDSKKLCMVLINKADFLTEKQREVWADYFTQRGIRIAFWSAVEETARQEEVDKAEAMETGENNSDDNDDDDDDNDDDGDDDDDDDDEKMDDNVKSDEKDSNLESNVNQEREVSERVEKDIDSSNVNNDSCASKDSETVSETDKPESGDTSCNDCGKTTDVSDSAGDNTSISNTSRVHTGPELLDMLKDLHKTEKVQSGLVTVGMVGYPNVGKSSTINAILKMKKVPVSATPGRTKHFQTLYVDTTLMLCDCPGLVFPSFVTTKADLVVSGILPIDQMRDALSPTALLCQRLPRWVLETTYGINLPKPGEGEDPNRPPTAHELLNAYGAMRGFMTSHGVPDGPRSSRYLLKDYVNGKLLFCHPPGDLDPVEFNAFIEHEPVVTSDSASTSKAGNQAGVNVVAPSRIDTEFFRKNHSTVHTRTARSQDASSSGTNTPGSSQASLNEKPWKKHNNRKKKEKLRRVYGYLDKCD